MRIQLEPLPTAVFLAVVLAWCVFAGIFLFRKKPPQAPERKRDAASLLGIGLHGLGYALVWTFARQPFSPVARVGKPVEIALATLTVGLVWGSIWLTLAAIRALGRQWAYVARVVEGRKLVTDGP